MNPTRRDVLATLTVCTACSVLGTHDASAQTAPATGPVDLGPTTDFAHPGIYDQFARQHKLFVVRTGEKLFASSSLCTHKSCVLKKKDDHLKCPCHQSEFDCEGRVRSGKATTPLPRFAIRIVNDRVMVDRSRSFDEANWDDTAASARIKSETSLD